MDKELFLDMLRIDSTSGREAGFAEFLAQRLKTPKCRVEMFEVGDGTENLMLSWGEPRVLFCSHLDTVPPYVAPEEVAGDESFRAGLDAGETGGTAREAAGETHGKAARITGRGTCDAKGQIFACMKLVKSWNPKGMKASGFFFWLARRPDRSEPRLSVSSIPERSG